MAKEMNKEMMCEHHKGMGTVALVVGLLILINTYWHVLGWGYFIGILIVLKGLLKLIKK